MTATQRPHIGRTTAESTESWPGRVQAPIGAPNVIVILLDDVGFASYSSFGAAIDTPNIDRLAREGLRYTNFHTSAVCSPTRASLLTGRNCHSVGFGHVTERMAGYPGYSMRLPKSAATLAAVLRDNGYATRAVGKWHVVPPYETGPQGPFERWPLGQGFERFYGFLGGSTDQFAPELYRDNSPVELPGGSPGEYQLGGDLVDEAIAQVGELRSLAPEKPFFLYLAFGACHTPHQAPREWIEKYKGRFDHGWDEERRRILARQIELGVFPAGTDLGPNNPGVQDWDSLSADSKRLFARMMEAFAGFLSYTDAQLGRLFDYLGEVGVFDETVVLLCSDNGASAEGGPEGSVDEGLYINDREQSAADALPYIDELGGPKLYNHYPWGWAQACNTPFRWYKQFTHAGGITNGLFLRWPGGEVPAGEFRRQYHHVIDVMPTVLDLVGIAPPATVAGVTQQPMHGVSMRYSFFDADADSLRRTQYYETWGNRGLWHDDWMAICRLQPDAPGAFPPMPITTPFDELEWELYDHRVDPTECHDVAAANPTKLRQLVDYWWAEAGRYDVLPVDIRPRAQRWPANPPQPAGSITDRTVFFGSSGPYERGVTPRIAGRSFSIDAEIVVRENAAQGVIYALGSVHGGYCWYLLDRRMVFEVASSSIESESVAVPIELIPGTHRVRVDVAADVDLSGHVSFSIDDRELGGADVHKLLRRMPIGSARTRVGAANGSPVSGAFEAPFAFQGELRRVTVMPRDGHTDNARAELEAEMRDQ